MYAPFLSALLASRYAVHKETGEEEQTWTNSPPHFLGLWICYCRKKLVQLNELYLRQRCLNIDAINEKKTTSKQTWALSKHCLVTEHIEDVLSVQTVLIKHAWSPSKRIKCSADDLNPLLSLLLSLNPKYVNKSRSSSEREIAAHKKKTKRKKSEVHILGKQGKCTRKARVSLAHKHKYKQT